MCKVLNISSRNSWTLTLKCKEDVGLHRGRINCYDNEQKVLQQISQLEKHCFIFVTTNMKMLR